ncbi:MAG: phosphatase PAP2 family protein [Sphaerotilus natans]
MRTLLAGALLALMLGLAAGLALCPAGTCRTLAPDRAGLALFHALRSDSADRLAATLTWAGSLALLLPAALARAAWLRRRQRPWHEAAFVPAALLGTTLLVHAVKLGVMRPRPDLFPTGLPLPPDLSFPSAHTAQALALVLALWLQPGRPRPAARWLAAGLMLAGAVAATRLQLQVHWPTDLIGGALMAAVWVLALARATGGASRICGCGRYPGTTQSDPP